MRVGKADLSNAGQVSRFFDDIGMNFDDGMTSSRAFVTTNVAIQGVDATKLSSESSGRRVGVDYARVGFLKGDIPPLERER